MHAYVNVFVYRVSCFNMKNNLLLWSVDINSFFNFVFLILK